MDASQISSFLLDRISEDLLIAARARRPWFTAREMSKGQRISHEDATHVERWAPGRVILEGELKREMVARCQRILTYPAESSDGLVAFSQEVLLMLANAYEHHTGFKQEWIFQLSRELDPPALRWLRITPLPFPDRQQEFGDWEPARISPQGYNVGDKVTVQESDGSTWEGVVIVKSKDTVALKPS